MSHEEAMNVQEIKQYLYCCINSARISSDDKLILRQSVQDFISMYKQAIYEQHGHIYL